MIDNLEKDLEFLREIQARFGKWAGNNDPTQIEFIQDMIDDWADELIERIDALAGNKVYKSNVSVPQIHLVDGRDPKKFTDFFTYDVLAALSRSISIKGLALESEFSIVTKVKRAKSDGNLEIRGETMMISDGEAANG